MINCYQKMFFIFIKCCCLFLNIFFFFQVKLEQNYQHSADYTIEKLQECLIELKKNKLDNAGLPSQNEQLKRELGIFNPDDIPVRKVSIN